MATMFVDQAVDELRASFRGEVLTPESPGYEEARQVWNGVIDRRPAVIARCSGTADVVMAVNFARETEMLVSIRGGGHNVAGNAVNDGGIVIDLSAMRGVTVEPDTRIARVQGGATWDDVDRETQLFGLAAPGGKASTTGVAGFTLHGGMSWFVRKVGLALDSLISVEIVTADGRVQSASTTVNPDLFWAVRGAGSNFGVVTSFEFALHPIGPEVFFAAPFYSLDDAPEVMRAYRSFTQSAPDEVSSQAVFWSVPAAEGFPPDLHRMPVLILPGFYAGSAEKGERALQPLREYATPVLDLSGRWPYLALQGAFDPFFPKGGYYYFKSLYLNALSDEVIDELISRAASRPASEALMALWHVGGAMGRVPEHATAFGNRDSEFMLSYDTAWTDPADTDRCIAWSRDAWQSLRKLSPGGLYLNFGGFGEEKDLLTRSGYGANYDRLTDLKSRYDPGNLFRTNHNIPPRL